MSFPENGERTAFWRRAIIIWLWVFAVWRVMLGLKFSAGAVYRCALWGEAKLSEAPIWAHFPSPPPSPPSREEDNNRIFMIAAGSRTRLSQTEMLVCMQLRAGETSLYPLRRNWQQTGAHHSDRIVIENTWLRRQREVVHDKVLKREIERRLEEPWVL